MMKPSRRVWISLLVALAGCRRDSDAETLHAAAASSPAPAPTNRIDVPAMVRANLGITFAKVQPRNVTRTIRVPGRFELLPQARREYRTTLGGRVELRVSQFDRVEPNQLLFTLDSPQWRELQERLSETEARILQARARNEAIDPLIAAHERHHDELQKGVEIWTERVQQLERTRSSGVVTAEEFAQARAAMATTRADLAEVLEKEAELRSRRAEVQAELDSARERFELLISNAATLLAVDESTLTEIDANSEKRHPRWREISRVQVRAAAPGVVSAIEQTNGAWAAETSLVLSTIQPEMLRFRAIGLQSDLHRFRDGLAARVVPPKATESATADVIEGTIVVGVMADPDERTMELFVTPQRLADWARPGVAAQLEVVTDGAGRTELAIPLSCAIRDGLRTVIFRRDPAHPDKVIRLEADLGLSDGEWVEVRSGLREGDEVVLGGVYPLMLATSGSAAKGGHVHADGTFHEGDK